MEGALEPLGPAELMSQSTSEFVYQRLREAIQTGSFAPYTRLIQGQLAEQLNVSRTPVRDALWRLANEDVVIGTPGRGYMVPDITPDDVRQVHHVRRALECAGVQEAAPNYSVKDIRLLRSLHEEAASADPAAADYFGMNCQFHLALIKPAENELLVRLLNQVWCLPAARKIAARYIDSTARTRRSLAEHKQLIAAAEGRDGPALVKLLAEHIDRSYTFATATIRSSQRADNGNRASQSD